MNNILNSLISTAKAADPAPITIQGIGFAKGNNILDLNKGIGNIISTIFFIAGTTALIYFVVSGIMYITSGGNPEAAKKGSQGLLYATIGIIVVALSYFLVTAIAAWAAKGTL